MARSRRRRVGANEVDKAMAALQEDHLWCRDFGHVWRPYNAEFIPQRQHYLETLVCTRCKTARHRLLGSRGELLGNSYTYVDGYRVEGIGRLTGEDRDALRWAGLQVLLRSAGQEPKSDRRLKAV